MFESDDGNYIRYEDFEKSQMVLKTCFIDVVWMAIRYAHGRSTYALGMVRDAINNLKKIFPDWQVSKDITIKSPGELRDTEFRGDYLDDLIPK